MIYNIGILKREHFNLKTTAFKHYRDRSDAWKPNSKAAIDFRAQYTHNNKLEIHFLGVWDTLGALGAPYGMIMGYLTNLIFHNRYHDTVLTPIIKHGYHAVSKDEKRWPFRPTLFEFSDKLEELDIKNNFEEKWFDGVHADVGGGYENAGLSDSALEWMAEKAKACDMNINLELLDPKLNPAEVIPSHNSQALYYRLSAMTLVKWPALLFVEWPGKIPFLKDWPDQFYAWLNDKKIIAEKDIREKIARIDPKTGNYQREFKDKVA